MRIAYKELPHHSFWHIADVDGRFVHLVDSAVYIGNFDYTLFDHSKVDYHGYPIKGDKLIEIPKSWDKVDSFFEVPEEFNEGTYKETDLFDYLKEIRKA